MSIASPTSVAIIINSCYKFYETTLTKIIPSCKIAGIPPSNIYVVVGECDFETDILQREDYQIVFCKYINIDYNAAIYFTQTERGLYELKKYTHFFYTHDTSQFMDCFFTKINHYARICDSYIKLQNAFSKNMGLFQCEWFVANKKELFRHFVNYDAHLILDYKTGEIPNKDYICSQFKNVPRWLNEDCMFLFTENHVPQGYYFINLEPTVYKDKIYTDEERIATVYMEPGIIKYQKNCVLEPNPDYIWDLTL